MSDRTNQKQFGLYGASKGSNGHQYVESFKWDVKQDFLWNTNH